MISRLRRAWNRSAGATVRAIALASAAVDKEDVLMLAGLALLAAGLWLVSHAAALIVPGLILLWIFLPSRPPFVDRPVPSNRRMNRIPE